MEVPTKKNPNEPKKMIKVQQKLLVFRDPVISSIHIRSDRQLILDPIAFYCNWIQD